MTLSLNVILFLIFRSVRRSFLGFSITFNRLVPQSSRNPFRIYLTSILCLLGLSDDPNSSYLGLSIISLPLIIDICLALRTSCKICVRHSKKFQPLEKVYMIFSHFQSLKQKNRIVICKRINFVRTLSRTQCPFSFDFNYFNSLPLI
jgi:hypothetical protein